MWTFEAASPTSEARAVRPPPSEARPKRWVIKPERLLQAREAKEIPSALALAERIGVDSSQITRWNNGASPTAAHLVQLSLTLGRSWAWLMGLENEPRYLDALRLEIKEIYGAAAVEALEALATLPSEKRAILVGKLIGWIEAGESKPGASSSPPAVASKTH